MITNTFYLNRRNRMVYFQASEKNIYLWPSYLNVCVYMGYSYLAKLRLLHTSSFRDFGLTCTDKLDAAA